MTVTYNLARTAEAQPVGSIVPWVGPLTDIPPGWLICDGQPLDPGDYPLLARVIQNIYGGDNFAGDFPNYTGEFQLPNINQKGLVDISTEYFTTDQTTPGADQPTLNIDTPESAAVIAQYIGTDSDIGVPGAVFAITDLDMVFTPDPDGTLISFLVVTGVAAPVAFPQLFEDVTQSPAFPVASGGNGATFNVVQNTNGTYSLAVKAKGQGYDVGDILVIEGSEVGGISPNNDITLQVESIGDPFFSGIIEGDVDTGTDLDYVQAFGVKTVFVVPRKLGRQHFPQHTHAGTYNTINTSDSGANPGRGPTVWENPQITVGEAWYGLNPAGGADCPLDILGVFGCRTFLGVSRVDKVNIWDEGQDVITSVINPFNGGVGRYTLASIRGTPPARNHSPLNTASDAHGVGKTWFTNAKKLRDKNGATSSTSGSLNLIRQQGKFDDDSTIPFSDESVVVGRPNYDDGTPAGQGPDDTQPPYPVLMNQNALSFLTTAQGGGLFNEVIQAHDHQGEFNIECINSSLTPPGQVNVSVQPNVIPDSVPDAFQIDFNTASPSVSVINLIRAY